MNIMICNICNKKFVCDTDKTLNMCNIFRRGNIFHCICDECCIFSESKCGLCKKVNNNKELIALLL